MKQLICSILGHKYTNGGSCMVGCTRCHKVIKCKSYKEWRTYLWGNQELEPGDLIKQHKRENPDGYFVKDNQTGNQVYENNLYSDYNEIAKNESEKADLAFKARTERLCFYKETYDFKPSMKTNETTNS